MNKIVRNQAYDDLVTFLRETYPEADHALEKKKIQNLRGSVRKETKKIEASIRSGREGKMFSGNIHGRFVTICVSSTINKYIVHISIFKFKK